MVTLILFYLLVGGHWLQISRTIAITYVAQKDWFDYLDLFVKVCFLHCEIIFWLKQMVSCCISYKLSQLHEILKMWYKCRVSPDDMHVHRLGDISTLRQPQVTEWGAQQLHCTCSSSASLDQIQYSWKERKLYKLQFLLGIYFLSLFSCFNFVSHI